MRALLILLALAACGQSAGEAPVALLDRIEAGLAMPTGAEPIGRYTRYYAATPDGREIAGVLLRTGPGGRMWVDYGALPFVLDGGCHQVNLRADRSTGRVLRIDCNGVA